MVKRKSLCGLCGLMVGVLLSGTTSTWAATPTTEIEQKRAIIKLMTAEEKLAMEAKAEPRAKAIYEKVLGKKLITPAYWPGKTWLDIQTLAVAYDGTQQKGEQFYKESAKKHFNGILMPMGIRPNITVVYENKRQVEDTREDFQKPIIVKYAQDKSYQLIIGHNDGRTFEGANCGPPNEIWGDPEVNYKVNAQFYGWDENFYGETGFYHGIAPNFGFYSYIDRSIPVSNGFYTINGRGISDSWVKRFVNALKKCQRQYKDWAWYDRQWSSNEHYEWAEYVWTKEEWLQMGWPAGEWHQGIKLNDRLKIPKKPDNLPIHEYGRAGAKDGGESRTYDYGGVQSPIFYPLLAKEYGKWQKTTKDSLGNYENVPWTLWKFWNDIPVEDNPDKSANPKFAAGFKPVFPEDVLSLAELKTMCKAGGGGAASSPTTIKVSLNGAALIYAAAPFISPEGRVMVPLRAIAEALGLKVSWDQKSQEITLAAVNKKVIMRIGKKDYSVNGVTKTMDTAPVIKDGTTFVPVRVIGEAFGKKVTYDDKNKTVIIE